VRALRRAGSSMAGLAGLPVTLVEGDILDRDRMARAVEGCDLVLHAAAISSYWRSQREQIYRVNADGTRAVMAACLAAGVPRVVHTSSAAAVGIAPDGPANEETPFDALSATFAYADSKRRAEEVVREHVARGLPAVIVNPTVVIGAGDHYQISGSIVTTYARGRTPVVPPGGTSVAAVEAVVRGHLAAAELGRVGERYILGGENVSYARLAGVIAEAAGVRPPPLVVPAPLLGLAAPAVELLNRARRGQPLISGEQIRLSQLRFFFSSDKAARELGYSLVPLQAAVEETLAWYRAHRII
jgi:dihydroflavonol-4-reductase